MSTVAVLIQILNNSKLFSNQSYSSNLFLGGSKAAFGFSGSIRWAERPFLISLKIFLQF